MDEEVALQFAADVEQAVASVRELAADAQDLATDAELAAEGLGALTASSEELVGATQGLSADVYEAGAAMTEEAAEARAAAAAAGDLAEAQAALKASAAEARDAVTQLATIQSTAGKDSAEYAAQLDAVAAAMQKQATAGEQLKGVQEQQAAAAAQAKAAAEESATATEATTAASAESATATEAAGVAQAGAATKADVAAAGLGRYKMALVGVGVGAAVAVDAASKFQDSTTHLVTDAGESAKNLSMVQQGILSVSAATGTSATDITNAMYHIESGGMHGASGLAVLKVAAQGAKVGGADLDTVSKTLVGTLNAYGMTSDNAGKQTQMATQLMNQLIATVGAGDMRMQDLASSLSNVAPLAAASGISFDEVGGAIATMTAQGMSARQSTQDLSSTIRALSNPNNVAIAEMQQMGLSSQQVSQQLGQRGLTGTLSILTKAITEHMGPSGMVIQSSFQASTQAASDANQMIKQMPPNLAKLAQEFMSGSVTSKQWKADLQGLDPVSAHLMTQFAGTAQKAHSFNSLLAGGGPAAQTYTAALAKVMGGATGLNTALMLTGGRMSTFVANSANVYNAGVTTGSAVDNWSTIQGTFNFKMQQATASLKDTGIALGTALLPAVSAVLGPLAHFLAVIASNKAASIALALVVGGILAGALGLKLAKSLKDASEGIKAAGDGIEWLIGKIAGSTAVTEAQAAATEAATAAQEAQTVATEAGAAAQEELDVAEMANPLGIIIIAVIALIAVIVLLITHWHAVAHAFDVVRHAIAAGVDWVISFVKAHWPLLVGIFLGPVALVIAELVQHWNTVKADVTRFIDGILNWVKSHWKEIVAWLVDPVGMAVFEIRQHAHQIAQDFDRLRHDVAAVLAGARHDIASAWDGIRHDAAAVLAGARHDIASAFDGVRHDIAAFIDWLPGFIENGFKLAAAAQLRMLDVARHDVATAFDDIRHSVAAGINDVLSFFQRLPGQVTSFLASLPGQMLAIGRNVITGLINGIVSAAAAIPSIMGSLASDVASYFTDPLKLFSPSRLFYDHGWNIVQGAINGVKANAPNLRAAMGGLGGQVAGAGIAGAIAPAGGSTSVHVSIPVTATAAAADVFTSPAYQQALQAAVQEVTLRYGQVNVSNGLTPGWGQ
jgi:TP901 family phage tail tape measure protein